MPLTAVMSRGDGLRGLPPQPIAVAGRECHNFMTYVYTACEIVLVCQQTLYNRLRIGRTYLTDSYLNNS